MTAVLTDVAANAHLDSAVSGAVGTATHLGVHTALGQGGAEVAGGSPAYARKAVSWNAAASRIKDITAGVTFDIPAGTTVRMVGAWSASSAGTIRAWSPIGASARRAVTVADSTDVTNNDIWSPAHGLVAGNSVCFWATIGAVLPAGLSEDTEYFVIATGISTDSFRVSATLGGAALDITAIGDGDVQKFTPEVFAGQGTYNVTAFPVTLVNG